MVAQTVLPFKLEMMQDTMRPHARLALFVEFVHVMSPPFLVDCELVKEGSGAG